MNETEAKPKNRDEAIKAVERIQAERRLKFRSNQWFFEQVENLGFFAENEIWDLMETYR